MTTSTPPAPPRHEPGDAATGPLDGGPPGLPVAAGTGAVASGLVVLGAQVILHLPPEWALAAGILAGLLTWCAVARPETMLLIAVVVEVVNLPGVASDAGIPGVFPAIFVLTVTALVAVLGNVRSRRRIGARSWWCVGLVVVYLVSQAVSLGGTTDLAVTLGAVDRRAVDCLFLIVLLLLSVASGSMWRVAGAVVVPLALLSLLSIANLVLLGGTSDLMGLSVVTQASGELTTTVRFGGPLPDSNFWGRHLVLGLPLALALALRAHRARDRGLTALWVGASAVLPVGMYLTQSRGTYLAAVVGVVVFILFADRTVRRRGLLVVPALACLFFLPGVGDRFISLVEDLGSDTGATAGVDPSVLGRSAAQEIAWQMFAERPLTGFGVGSYAGLVPEYADRVPTSVADPTDAPHNLYAELAAETGILGMLGWAVLVVGVTAMLVHRLAITRDVGIRRLGAAVLGGLVAWSVASIFLHLAYFRTFGLLVVLAAAVCTPREPDPREVSWINVSRMLASVVAAVALASLAATGTALSLARDRVQAVGQLVVIPRGAPDTLSAWPLDVQSRHIVMPTFAALFDSGVEGVRYTGDPVRGGVTVHVTAPDATSAVTTLLEAEASARERLEIFGIGSNFRVVAFGAPAVSPARDVPAAAYVTSAAVGAGVLVLSWLVIRRRVVAALAGQPPADPPATIDTPTTRRAG